MRFPLYCLLLVCYFVSQNVNAQATAEEATAPLNETLVDQFDKMVSESNRYQKFRVIPNAWLSTFKASMQDSLAANSATVTRLESDIDRLEQQLEEQSSQIAKRDESIATLSEEKDGISLFGSIVSKTLYNSVLWGLIIALVAGVLFLFGRSRYAIALSRSMESNNEELVAELDQVKRRRLEVEQDLRRKLQDERNKNNK